MPDRDYYTGPSPKMAEIRTKYLAHVRRCLSSRRSPARRTRPSASSRSRPRIANAHVRAPTRKTFTRRTTTGRAPTSPPKAPGLDWPTFLDAAGLGSGERLRGLAADGRDRNFRAGPARRRSTRGRRTSTFHALDHAARFCRRRSPTRASPFTAGVLAGVPQQRDALEARASKRRAARSSRRSASSTSTKYFPPAEKARAEAMVKNLIAAFGTSHRHARLDVAGDEGEGEGQARGAQGRRRLSRRLARLHGLQVVARRRARQRERAEQFDYQRNLAQDRQAGRSRRVGDAAAAGQRGEPSGDERAELPRGDLGAARSSIPTRPDVHGLRLDRRGHRPRDQPQLRRSGRDVRRDGQVGELVDARGPHALQGIGRGARRQFDAYKPFPDVHVNGKQTLSENIADIAGLSTPTTPIARRSAARRRRP